MPPTEYEDLGDPDAIAMSDADSAADDYIEELLEEDDEMIFDEEAEDFISSLIDRVIVFCEALSGVDLRPYQMELARRMVRSLILADGEVVTALFSRQSGKSEAVSVIVSGVIVLFPKLAEIFKVLERFKNGVWIGVFAPVEGQSEFVYGRIVDKLTSDNAKLMLADPEIDVKVDAKSRILKLSNGSLIRRQTANPKAKVEGATYHLVVLDEAQDCDDLVVSKSISPMLASTAGTTVKIGTPSFHKGNFFRDIQYNKRRGHNRKSTVNHFEADWKIVSKYNAYYEKFIKQEKNRIGEDSDEFQMCVSPDTRVLTADMRHIRADEVTEGLELVGFDEYSVSKGMHRKLRPSVVEAVSTIIRPSYVLELDDGTSLSCSAEHLWLVTTAGRRTEWKTTEDLTLTDKIFKITDVWEQESSRDIGYLAGIFDGEGHLSNPSSGAWQLGMSQKEGVVLDKTRAILDSLGYGHSTVGYGGTNGNVARLNITGGRAAVMRFLGHVRPERLLQKMDISRLGSIGRHDHTGQDFRHPTIISKTFIGEQPVIAFRTSTRTFIAEGLASHNSYALKWQLGRGMLITDDELDYLADKSMGLVRSWHASPVVVGIDPARTHDSTVVTVVWVDWEHPDAAGYMEHRVLNWLELNNTDWESQYFEIIDFLANYDVAWVAVDKQGMGDPVAERLALLLGHRCEVVAVGSDVKSQTERWTHLIQLLQRNMLVYPGHSKARRTRVWKRFRQQMEDAEKRIQGQYMLVAAPDDSRSANDDFVDSLALACVMSKNDSVPEVEVMSSPFYG